MNDLRKVSSGEAKARAQSWKCDYLETSAKTRQNVDEAYTAYSSSLLYKLITGWCNASESVNRPRAKRQSTRKSQNVSLCSAPTMNYAAFFTLSLSSGRSFDMNSLRLEIDLI
jgi:hypothetical protein